MSTQTQSRLTIEGDLESIMAFTEANSVDHRLTFSRLLPLRDDSDVDRKFVWGSSSDAQDATLWNVTENDFQFSATAEFTTEFTPPHAWFAAAATHWDKKGLALHLSWSQAGAAFNGEAWLYAGELVCRTWTGGAKGKKHAQLLPYLGWVQGTEPLTATPEVPARFTDVIIGQLLPDLKQEAASGEAPAWLASVSFDAPEVVFATELMGALGSRAVVLKVPMPTPLSNAIPAELTHYHEDVEPGRNEQAVIFTQILLAKDGLYFLFSTENEAAHIFGE